MPIKTKDKQAEDTEILAPKKATSKSSTTKKATKKTTTKTPSIKKESSPKNTKKSTVAKKATAKKVAAKKEVPLKENKKNVVKKTTKKESSKNASGNSKALKKENTKKPVNQSTTRSRKKKTTLVEYYDLPSHYEQTIVKILAQTPSILFVYWNISDKDTKKLLQQYGENFFNETSPFLIVINKTKNYQFEVEINDYANSWYLHIPDSDCEYEVILIRKNKDQQAENHIVSITSSNQLETPNDHILFEKLGKTIFFQNTKTKNIEEKDISSFSFMSNIGRIYNIYDLYKEIYKNELDGDELGIGLSSSQFSSTFK